MSPGLTFALLLMLSLLTCLGVLAYLLRRKGHNRCTPEMHPYDPKHSQAAGTKRWELGQCRHRQEPHPMAPGSFKGANPNHPMAPRQWFGQFPRPIVGGQPDRRDELKGRHTSPRARKLPDPRAEAIRPARPWQTREEGFQRAVFEDATAVLIAAGASATIAQEAYERVGTADTGLYQGGGGGFAGGGAGSDWSSSDSSSSSDSGSSCSGD